MRSSRRVGSRRASLLAVATTGIVALVTGCRLGYSCNAKGCGASGVHVSIVMAKDGGTFTGDEYVVELHSPDLHMDDVCRFNLNDPRGCTFGEASEVSVSVPLDRRGAITIAIPEDPQSLRIVVRRDGDSLVDETMSISYHTSILDNGDAPECKSQCKWADPVTFEID